MSKQQLFAMLKDKSKILATAESCTGGMIASAITDVPGSSSIFDRGFVTYSNQAKIDMLGVKKSTLETYGAVSAETAAEMALGAIKHSIADFTVSTTGIAGPGGGSADKPVGLVYIGLAGVRKDPISVKCLYSGSRASIRAQTVEKAFLLLMDYIS